MAKRKRNRKTKITDLPTDFKSGFINKIDNRTGLAKLLKHNYRTLVDDQGGANEISHVKDSLIQRFVFLDATLLKIENDMANTPEDAPELMGKWIQAVNSLSGLAKTIGIERRVGVSFWGTTAQSLSDKEEATTND